MPSPRLVDYDRNSSLYDQRHGSRMPADEALRLVEAAGLGPGARVLEVGAGTGRVSLAFAERGLSVVAVDRSLAMLRELRRKDSRGLVAAVRGDADRLPVTKARVEAVVIARLLYLVPDWPTVLEEALRALRGGGRLLHEWANGAPDEPWVMIREKARALFQARGVSVPFHPGATSEADVHRFLSSHGAQGQRVSLGPSRITTTPREFLGRLLAGELSYTWDVPEPVLRECRPLLAHWVHDVFDDVDAPASFPREVYWWVYRFP